MLSKHRIEALSDGVFAVVMTLLVLEIKPEPGLNGDDAAVRLQLRGLVAPVLTFATAFLISCAFWSLHHRKFAVLRGTNPVHSGLTLTFLFTVTLLPVSVSLFLHAKASDLARAVYFCNFTLIAATLFASWFFAQRAGLVDPAQPDDVSRELTRRCLAMTTVGIVATVASLVGMPSLWLLAVPVIAFSRRRPPTKAAT